MGERDGGAPRRGVWAGALLGAGSMACVIALGYLGDVLLGLPSAAFDLFEWIGRSLPGRIVTLGIDGVVALVTALSIGPTAAAAKLAEVVLAVVLALAIGALAGGAIALASRRVRPAVAGASAGGLLAIGAIAVRVALGLGRHPLLSVLWIAALLIGWGLAVAAELVAARPVPGMSPAADRRRVLVLVGWASGLAAIGLVAGRLVVGRRRVAGGEQLTSAGTSGPAASPDAGELAARLAPVPGTRPEITANRDFYRIDINLRPPALDAARWRLELAGLVRRPLSFSLDELRARRAVSQMVTLECISNRVGGDLISTGRWTGVRLRDLLAEAGLWPEAGAIAIQAADGFHESVELQDALDPRTLLVYEMNGVPLPVEHGFPLRIYVPDRHGMKLPKWIEKMEVVERARPGYWVERGWSARAVPNTTAVIDVIGTSMMLGQQKTLPIGGIAYAGARGISRVEVQVDDGPWSPARLRAPALGPLTWVQWRFDWPYRPGRHTFRVRAHDGTGALQPTAERGPHPDGATGIHSITTTV